MDSDSVDNPVWYQNKGRGVMPSKSFSVRFANSNIGADPATQYQLRDTLAGIVAADGIADGPGHHLPIIQMEGEHFQIRSLVRIGRFWRGSFARLRDEAPHIIGATNVEREIDLEVGDRLLEKSFFLYYEESDVLVFQMSRNVGYLTRFAHYWSRLLNSVYVDFPPIIDQARIQEILTSGIKEINFTYSCAPGANDAGPSWTQRAMEMLRPVHGAKAKFSLRAPRGGLLGGTIGDLVRWAARGGEVERAKVYLQDEKDPIDLFLDPIKVRIEVRMNGRYPDERSAIEQLGEAYAEQAHRFPERPRRQRGDGHRRD